MKPDWRLCTLTWLAFLSFGATRVLAETTAAERETARSAMDDGDRLRSSGDHHAALARYKAADDIMHVPTTGIEVAREQATLGMLVEARAAAIQTANSPVAASEPSVFTEARAAATQLAATLELRIPSLATRITPSGADYTLAIDKVELPTQARSLPFRTNPGEHQLVVKARGFATTTIVIPLAEAERRSVTVALHALPKTAPVATVVQAPPEALRADADDPGQLGRIRGYVALGVGSAALGAGIVTGIVSAVETSSVKKQCRDSICPDSVSSKLHTANTLANIANIGIPVGLLVAGYGVFELLRAPHAQRPASAASTVQIHADAHGAYAAWGGNL